MQSFRKTVFLFFLAVGQLVLQSCATAPENIQPHYVSEISYSNCTCEQLGQEQTRLVEALSTVSSAQRTARTNDIVGVIVIGLPVASLAGANMASEIAITTIFSWIEPLSRIFRETVSPVPAESAA